MSPSWITCIIVLSCSSQVYGNYWSGWSRWSACSRTCDGGATYQTRKCIRSRTYKLKCSGMGIRYSTCKNKPCPSGIPDFRAEQCAAYNDASYSGHYFRWLPYHDKEAPCALSCIAEGTKMVAILAPKVLDGTRCNTFSLDMCINGKCVSVGCDHKLGSRLKMDTCGTCGGNNTCSHNRRMAGRYRWIETGFRACSVTCGVGVKEKRLLCFDTRKGKMMDFTYCDNLIRPAMSKESCSLGACPPEWRVGPWQNCTRDCGGGVSWRIVTCVQTFDDGTQQIVRDSLCTSLRPSSRKSCNGFICPTWYAGDWSICSASCGTGLQKREVICRHIGDTFCRRPDKPRTAKNCTTGIPCYNLNDHRYIGRRMIDDNSVNCKDKTQNWERNSDDIRTSCCKRKHTDVFPTFFYKGDIQERNVGEFQGSPDTMRPQGDEAITKEDLYQPRFVTTTWDSCSESCGEGVRFRYVRCQVFLRYLDDFVDLPDEDCEEEKPAEYESCMIEPCYDLYEWVAVGMTECSSSCLGGIQETILQCVTKENVTTVKEDFCLEAAHVQIERRICNDKPCPPRWEIGQFGECSETCGTGNKSRTVKCIQEYAQGPSFFTLPEVMCKRPVPESTTDCNTIDCPAKWAVGNWSDCSVTCGLGIIARRPLCQRIRNRGLVNVSLSECEIKLKPETEKPCNMTPCPEPMIKTKDVKFFQLNRIQRVKLLVGMQASVLPETNIIMKCPNVGLDRQKITWFKNGYKFRRSKRARVARSGALRIRHARPGKDDAVYSCLVGGLEANISIAFSTSFEVLEATVFREKYIKGTTSPPYNLMNGTVLHMDPVDRESKPLNLIATDWTTCSVTCGGGLQTRNMSCEIITSDYYQVLPNQECFKHLTVPPLLIQSCNTKPCVKWKSGNWSTCTDQECVRYRYSLQRRDVFCENEFNNTVTDASFCEDLGFPPDNVRDCYNPNCTAEWNASKWSKCLAECDETGYKTRMLDCIWTKTKEMAPHGSCNTLKQPVAMRKCKGQPCVEIGKDICEDESDYCSIIKVMNMCYYSNFQERCCWTCNEDFYDEYDTEGDTDDATTVSR